MLKNHQDLLALVFPLLAAGCFGSDPNMNSQIFLGAAGTTGTGPGTLIATFDSSLEGFALDGYMDSDPTMQTNIANAGEWSDKGKSPPMLTFQPADGDPNPGCLQVVAPFDGKNQHFDIQSPSLSPTQNFRMSLRAMPTLATSRICEVRRAWISGRAFASDIRPRPA